MGDMRPPEAIASTALRYQAGGRAFARIASFHPELTAFRRDLHANPELGFEEVYTAARVQESLRACGVDEIHSGIGKTGVVGVIRGRSTASGRMIGLRADMDALPMKEANPDLAWRSARARPLGRRGGAFLPPHDERGSCPPRRRRARGTRADRDDAQARHGRACVCAAAPHARVEDARAPRALPRHLERL